MLIGGATIKFGEPVVKGLKKFRNWKLEDAELGRDVRTWWPGEIGYVETWPVIVTVREREVRLVQERDGARAEVALLRPESWFAESGVSAVGDCVELNLEELDLAGAFQVLELGEVRVSTYVRRAGFGRVTGRFQFNKGETFNLFVAGESRPIGVTGQHPFWSADFARYPGIVVLSPASIVAGLP